MAAGSAIEWTNATWNVVTGCDRVSPGCDNCYALRFAERFRDVPGHYFENGFDLTLRPRMLSRPAEWRHPQYVFVNSMSDLFHVGVPDSYLDEVFAVMTDVDRHTYQVLTKRPERMRRYIAKRFPRGVPGHIWLGVSVEDNRYAWRADMLREIDVPVRFLSVEPMIGAIDRVSLAGISWVIVGGESGPGFRPIDAEWVRDVRDRCDDTGIAFFFKQWHKANTGRLLDGRTWDGRPDQSEKSFRRSARA